MTRLSVNINKVATLRNARGKNTPNLLQVANDCERFGGQGITVHPRPDERHIRYADVLSLKGILTTEFNIEGYPSEEFMDLVLKVRPHQVTLVPDAPDAITSNAGWDTMTHAEFLSSIIERLHQKGIRVSVFVDPQEQMVDGAANIGADRVELFTEAYADEYPKNPEEAIAPYLKAAQKARSRGLRINAGHDLSLENLHYFVEQIPYIDEVSIGHALISDALYMGLEATIKAYREALVVEERA